MANPKKQPAKRDTGNQFNDLNDRVVYWWVSRGNRTKAVEYADKFERLLELRGKDDGSITFQEQWGLVHEVKGRLGRAVACREREIKLVERALRIGGPVGPVDYRHLAMRIRGLIGMYIENGQTAKATATQQKLQRLLRMHHLDPRAIREPSPEQPAPEETEALTTEIELADRCEHHCLPLIDQGIELNDLGRPTEALPYFERALRVSPGCPFATYDQANTLHSLGRDNEAETLLRDLIRTSPAELSQRCASTSFRSVQIDAYFLLFRVLIYGRGFSKEAFAFAEKHLSMRRRGVRSAWSTRQVRADIAAMRRAWKLGVKLTGPAPPVPQE